MKTKHSILSLALAAALVGTLALPAPKAQADDHAVGYIIVGALIGGALGYILNDSDDHRDYRRAEVRVAPPAPVVVYQPVVYQPQPVIVTRPVVYQPQPHCPVIVRPANPYRDQPANHYGNDRDRRPEPVAVPSHHDSRNERPGNGNRDYGRR